jgi:hypothetical protein
MLARRTLLALLAAVALLVGTSQLEAALSVDFGSTSGAGPLQPGYVAFDDTEGGGNPPKVRSYASPLGVGGSVGVKVRGFTHFRDYAAITGGPFVGQSDLLSDNVLRNADGTMRLTLDNLNPGTYQITTYHHSTQFGNGTLDIRLFDAAGLNQTVANAVPVTHGTSPASISTQTFQFVAGGSSVGIDFLGGSGPQHNALDGFDLDLVAGALPVVKTEVLAVDFNDRAAVGPGNTQSGFDEFVLAGGSGGSQSYGPIDVTLSPTGSSSLDDRRRGQPTNGGAFTEQELLRDFVFATGTAASNGLDVLIEGLQPNTRHEVTLWSFDDGSAAERISDWYVNGLLAVDNYAFDGNAVPAGQPASNDVYSFSFLADTNVNGELLIGGRAAGGGDPRVFLNALRLSEVRPVPEPGTLLIWSLLAGLGIGVAWRRRKK